MVSSVILCVLGGSGLQQPRDLAEVSSLEKPDSGHASCSGLNARTSILQAHAAQRQYRDVLLAGLTQSRQSGRSIRHIFLFEYRSKYGKVRTFGSRAGNVCNCVARNSDHREIPPPCAPHPADVLRRNILRAQVYAIGPASNSNIHA